LDITLVNGQRSRRLDLRSIRRFVERLVEVAPPGGADRLAVCFVSDRTMRSYNRRYRARDATTDVLSFPDGTSQALEGGRHLGDIVISVPEAERQAREAGHAVSREIRILLLHGYLHLLGHDHATDGGAMMRLERRLRRLLLPARRSA
jgi:probable rRNA maturation factor